MNWIRVWSGVDSFAVLVERDDTIRSATDRELSDSLFYIDVRLAEHREIDCMGGGEFQCESCGADFNARDEITAEQARREAAGIQIDDPYAETLEERLAPFGTEWQLEQRERTEGR